MIRDGDPIVFVERGGRGLLRLATLDEPDLAAVLRMLADAAAQGTLPKLAVERVDGEPVIGSGLEAALIEAGFSRQPRKLVAGAAPGGTPSRG